MGKHENKDITPAPAGAERRRPGPGAVLLRIGAFLLATLLLLVAGLFGVMLVLTHGPSETARGLFVMSVRETSAIGFLADIFVSQAEIAAIEAGGGEGPQADATDAALITIAHAGAETADGGIEIVDVSGPSFRGKLMVVADPTRVFVGVPDSFGGKGLTLEEMVEKNGAVAGVNGGGFDDPGGGGSGGVPDGVVICEGELLYGATGRHATAVIDWDGVLHVGDMTGEEALALDARWAVSFGPVLVVNGEKCEGLTSGLNPRTAIGQRADGAMLLLVIDGRQVDSLGATYDDVADVLLAHGAVNAMNLDGGSSTMMMHEGAFLNTCASVIGPRALPTAILVRGEGEA